jgi:3'-phosphoadenosine 5'-phosphosulfate sulfotransferase (PAPS reductase)/FAD synthetase
MSDWLEALLAPAPVPACDRPERSLAVKTQAQPALLPLNDYAHVVLAFSGGKDSLACLLRLIELGVSPDRIELHHHHVDGREGSTLMDWPCTTGYVAAVARHFGLRLSESWRQGGFEREMLRKDERTAPVVFVDSAGQRRSIGGQRGALSTRRRFPQTSADLSVRWCSAALKIDPGAAWLRHEPRFDNCGPILFVTGERAAESAARSRYPEVERHRADNRHGHRVRRHIDHWRPVHRLSTPEVWAMLERHRIRPAPPYYLGFARMSCAACIFGGPRQWATLRQLDPQRFERIAQYERDFGYTIHRSRSVDELANATAPYAIAEPHISMALSRTWDWPIQLDPWIRPLGADNGDERGPT